MFSMGLKMTKRMKRRSPALETLRVKGAKRRVYEDVVASRSRSLGEDGGGESAGVSDSEMIDVRSNNLAL